MNLRRKFGLDLIIILVVVSLDNAAADSGSKAGPDNERTAGDALYLTPLLEDGQADAARNKAKVTHLQFLTTESYAGYFTVNKISNSNLFFWYFPAKENSANAPVVLFLEGGPGVTSMFSLFLQNGPFSVISPLRLERREESWTKNHNVIYIDNPVGTGYSFTGSDAAYPTTQIQIGDELRVAMQQFFQLFPALRKNNFFVAGESYAGKYVPSVAYSIHQHNADTEEDKKINLKGIAIANGYTDPLNQLQYGEYLYKIGLVDANGRDQFLALEKQVADLISVHKHAAAYEVAAKLVEGEKSLFKNLTGYNGAFNILETEEGINLDPAFNFVQRVDVRRALHVGNNAFVPYAEKVANRLKEDTTQSQADLVAALLDHYRVLIYTGHLDIVCSYSSVRNYLQQLKWSGADEYKTAPRQQWRAANGELAGYAKKVGNLTEVLVRKAGHLSSRDQPKWTLELLTAFTRGSF